MVNDSMKERERKRKKIEKDVFRLSLFLYRAQNLPSHLFYLQI